MGRPAGALLDEVEVTRDRDIPPRYHQAAIDIVRAEMEAMLKERCSRPYPPSGAPGDYPAARTYRLVEGLHVVYSRPEHAYHVYSKAPHGKWLQNGQVNGGQPRPFGDLIQQERDWNERVRDVAAELAKGARRR